MYYEKMSDDVQRAFTKSGLADPDPEDPPWLGMHPKLAQVYMTALAEQLAASQSLCPVAQRPVDLGLAVSGCTVERLAHALLGDVALVTEKANDRETESIIASVAFENVLPVNLEALDPDRILDFRERHHAERGAFQKYVSEFLASHEWLADVKDAEALKSHVENEYKKTLKPKLEEFKAQLHDVGIDTFTGCCSARVALLRIPLKLNTDSEDRERRFRRR